MPNEADLAALTRDAAKVEAEIKADAPGAAPGGERAPGAGEPPPKQEYLPDPVKMVAGALFGLGKLLAVRCPAVAAVYTPARCHATAVAVCGALDAMGWDPRNSKFMAIATGMGALLMLSIDTVGAVRGDLAGGHPPGQGGGGGLGIS